MTQAKLSRRFALGAGLLTLAEGFRVIPTLKAVGVQPKPVGIMQPTSEPRPHTTASSLSLSTVDASTWWEWPAFKHRFVTPDGQIVDTGNGGIAHSEGQGIGLLGAVAWNDPEAFDRILFWTEQHLKCRRDALHAWRYLPGWATPVPDLNNATDGDLLIAVALSRAARRWGRLDLFHKATLIAQDIQRLLVRQIGGWTLLLPAAAGFEVSDVAVVNPSYYAFGLFHELEALAPSPVWTKLRQDGVALIMQGRFGRWHLPPDWLAVSRDDGALSPAPGRLPRFSYDAIRIPLHMAWGGVMPGSLQATLTACWKTALPSRPAWVDLRTGETAHYAASFGMQRIMDLTLSKDRAITLFARHAPESAGDYYSMSLALLARLCLLEAQERSGTTDEWPAVRLARTEGGI